MPELPDVELPVERVDLGLTDEEEERADRLHGESIVVDLVSRHAGSRVFDSLPTDLRAELMDRIGRSDSPSEILDLSMWWPFELALEGRSDLVERWLRRSGLTVGAYEPILALPQIPDALGWDWDRRIRRYTELPWLRHIRTAGEIRAAKRDGAIGLFSYCQPITPAPRSLDSFDDAHARGLRSMMLTYNDGDHVGGGSADQADTGLTDYGRSVVARLDDLGVVIDTSHCGHRTTLDACSASRNPIMASHTTAAGLYPHPRGKKDAALRAIADTGGVVGVLAIPAFLTDADPASIDNLIDHVDYLVDLLGWRHVGIGTDWPWPIPDDVASWVFDAARTGFRAQEPSARRRRLRGYQDSLDLPNITRALVAREYADEQIRGILGENALRVFEAVWGE